MAERLGTAYRGRGQATSPPSTSPDSGGGPHLRGDGAFLGHGNRIQSGPVWAAAQLHCAQRDGPRLCPGCPTPNPANTVGPLSLTMPTWDEAGHDSQRSQFLMGHDALPVSSGGVLYPAHHHRCVSWLSGQTRRGLDHTTSAPLYRAPGQGNSEEGPGSSERPVTIRGHSGPGKTRLDGQRRTRCSLQYKCI